MPLWLPTIIYIFTAILIIDSLGSFAIWKYTKNPLILKASIAWGANFVNFAIHGAAQNHALLTLVGHSFYFITACSLSSILCDVIRVEFPNRKFFIAGILTLIASLASYLAFENYTFSALLLDAYIAFPMIFYSIKTFKKENSQILAKAFAVLLIINGLHFLDYPFLHDDPVGSVVGFSFAFLLSILISILLPSLILQISSEKYTNELESIVAERTSKLKVRTEALEQTNRDNATLVSIVCHDISTPVMIANYSLAILGGPRGQPNLIENKDFQKIQKSLTAVTEILRRVKEIHSVKLGKLEPVIQLHDLEVLIFDVIQLYQPISDQKNVSLDFIVKDQSKKMAYVDSVLFKNQVLGNLLSNAIKFSDSGQKIEILLSSQANTIVVDVIDHGKGISKEKVQDLFDFNKPTTTKGTNSESGTGLGLPTVKLITEKMGGQITVTSNKGTTFKLQFKGETTS